MRVAIPIWAGRVSPVMDAARRLLIIDIDEGRANGRNILEVDKGPLQVKAEYFRAQGIDCLLCGAVSNEFLEYLNRSGVEVHPWLSGPINEVLSAYLQERLTDPRYLMPGCCQRRRRRGRK